MRSFSRWVVVLSLVLAACSSARSEVPSIAADTTVVPASTDGVATTAAVPTTADSSPEPGDEVEVLIRMSEDCANSGIVIAFGREWYLWRSASPIWRTFEPSVESVRGDFRISGTLRFESWDASLFEANGEVLELTTTRFVNQVCNGWEVS